MKEITTLYKLMGTFSSFTVKKLYFFNSHLCFYAPKPPISIQTKDLCESIIIYI